MIRFSVLVAALLLVTNVTASTWSPQISYTSKQIVGLERWHKVQLPTRCESDKIEVVVALSRDFIDHVPNTEFGQKIFRGYTEAYETLKKGIQVTVSQWRGAPQPIANSVLSLNAGSTSFSFALDAPSENSQAGSAVIDNLNIRFTAPGRIGSSESEKFWRAVDAADFKLESFITMSFHPSNCSESKSIDLGGSGFQWSRGTIEGGEYLHISAHPRREENLSVVR